MKKQLTFFLATIFSLNFYAQISFEAGYYIDNAGQKNDVQIKNIDWKNNPTNFIYSLSEGSEPKEESIESVKEFGIYDVSKYVRRLVKIDRSSNKVGRLSDVREAVFEEEKLFLRVLLEGKASLYYYEDGNLKRYFYNLSDGEIKQLVFKKYQAPGNNNDMATNNRFRQQLWNELKCQNIPRNYTGKLDYKKRDLMKFFMKYNECHDAVFRDYEEKKRAKKWFNLNIRPGIRRSSLWINNLYSDTRDAEFETKIGFRFGIEAEFVLPYNKNKWAILIEPTYQYYESEKALETRDLKVNYKSIEIPVGLRHYFFLNDKSTVFVNASFIFDLTNNKAIIVIDPGTDLDIRTGNNLAFGLGYEYNDKYSLELRYQLGRTVLGEYPSWSSSYKSLDVMLGYNIF